MVAHAGVWNLAGSSVVQAGVRILVHVLFFTYAKINVATTTVFATDQILNISPPNPASRIIDLSLS